MLCGLVLVGSNSYRKILTCVSYRLCPQGGTLVYSGYGCAGYLFGSKNLDKLIFWTVDLYTKSQQSIEILTCRFRLAWSHPTACVSNVNSRNLLAMFSFENRVPCLEQ